MSGPLEERLVDALQDALDARHDAAEWPVVARLTMTEANAAVIAAARALLAASGTGEPPGTAKAWLHSDPGRCNHVETGHMGRVPSCKNPQGEWIPLVPDAGTGTPSDDGRGAQSVLDRLRGLVWAEVARLEGPPQGKTGGWGSKHWAEGVNVARSVAARELRAALTDGPTPAAPSGTTGATTGGPHDDGVPSWCDQEGPHRPHTGRVFWGSPPCPGRPTSGATTGERGDERAWHCLVRDAGYPADHCSPDDRRHEGNDYCGWPTTPPSTGAESRDDR